MAQEFVVFVGSDMSGPGRRDAELISELLEEIRGVRCINGYDLGGQPVYAAIQSRINECDCYIGVLTRRERLADGEYLGSSWVNSELVHADAVGKRIIVLVERGTRFTPCIVGDVERIDFSRTSTFARAILRLVHQVKEIMRQRGLTVGVVPLPPAVQVPAEAVDDCWPERVRDLVREARERGDAGDIEGARRCAEEAWALDKTCWRALLSIGTAQACMDELPDADKTFKRVIKKFPSNKAAVGHALRNRAWVLERMGSDGPSDDALLEEGVRLLNEALTYLPQDANVRAMLLINYVLLGRKERVEALLNQAVRTLGLLFFRALAFEVGSRGRLGHCVVAQLPELVGHILTSINTPGGRGYGSPAFYGSAL